MSPQLKPCQDSHGMRFAPRTCANCGLEFYSTHDEYKCPACKRLTKEHPVMKVPTLAPREKQVLSLLAEALSNKEIAQRLYLTEGTVKEYVTRLCHKFKLVNRTALAIWWDRQQRPYQEDVVEVLGVS